MYIFKAHWILDMAPKQYLVVSCKKIHFQFFSIQSSSLIQLVVSVLASHAVSWKALPVLRSHPQRFWNYSSLQPGHWDYTQPNIADDVFQTL